MCGLGYRGFAVTKPRNGHRERKAKKLRDFLNSLDPPRRAIREEVTPPKRVIREESYIRMNPVALPRTVSLFKDGQEYVPEKPVATRPGADSHQRYNSKGM